MTEIARTEIATAAPRAVPGGARAPGGVGVPGGAAVRLTQAQKAAVVLCLLGRDAARTVFESLEEQALERFAAAMSGLGHIDEETVAEVVVEFLDRIDAGEGSVRGGLEKARALLSEHFDPPAVERIFRELEGGSGGGPRGGDVWARLARVDAKVLAGLLAAEHPQSAAVVISRLPAEYAGQVASRMPAGTLSRICLAIRRMRDVDVRLVELIGDNVSQALAARLGDGHARRPSERVAAIMDNTRGELRDEVIGLIEGEDPGFAQATRRSMFTFETLPRRLRPRDVAAVVRSADARVLVTALAGDDEADEATRIFLLSNISTRFADQISQEIRELAGTTPREIEEAQREMMRIVLRLDRAGEIRLVKEQDGEED